MESFFCKKIVLCILVSLLLEAVKPSLVFAGAVLWPSEMNLYNDSVNLDKYLPIECTSSNSRKGFLFTGDPKEIFTLGAGHIGVNVTMSGKGHVIMQYLEGLKKRGIKITVILINDKAPVNAELLKAPKEYRNPYCYMIDFEGSNGDWQKYNFNRIIDDYVDIADNWVIGNEINSQLYNFYGEADIETYTKKYCDSFKICYEAIKKRNPNANVYMSFDQGWDIPTYDRYRNGYDEKASMYRYNMKEQLDYINQYLDRSIDWGVSLHPYPAPVEEAAFWDDEYAGFDELAEDKKERPYLLTLKNFEIAIDYLKQDRFLKLNKEVRNIAITEFAVTSKNGEREQAAGLYYLWEKMKDEECIKYLLYNAQTDLPDGYNFGLSTMDENRKRRLAWVVFKDMDRGDEGAWCKDLLDTVLDEHDYIDYNKVIWKKASLSELQKINPLFKNIDIR